MIHPQDRRLFNRRLVDYYLCAQCGSKLREMYDESVPGKWRVVCPRDHAHEGHVTELSVELARKAATMEGLEVRLAYPELFGADDEPKKSAQELTDELFGREATTCR